MENAIDGEIIKVTADFNAKDLVYARIPVKEGCFVTLDLNGHMITFEAGGDVFGTQANSALLVKNGTMDYFDTDNYNSEGVIILCNVNVLRTAWLGSSTTWVVNNTSIPLCVSESGRVNPGSALNPIGTGYNSSYQYENPAPAMIGSGVIWSCYEDLKTDFEKVNADSKTNSNVILLVDSVLAEDADLAASGILMDFSGFKVTNGEHSFSVSNNEGKNTIRSGILEGDLDLTAGTGDVSISNMTVTGEIMNQSHAVDISGGFYHDISTGTGKVTITDGYFSGTLSGSSYEISGGYYVERPDDAFLKDGYYVIPCSETVDNVVYHYMVAEGCIVSFDANGGETTVERKLVEKEGVIGALPVPAYADYSFDGWFTEPDGGTEVTAESTVSSHLTLYAHWTQIETTMPPVTTTVTSTTTTTTTTAATTTGTTAAATSSTGTRANNNTASTVSVTQNKTVTSPATGDAGIPSAAAGIGMAALTAAAGAYALSRKKEDLQEHKK